MGNSHPCCGWFQERGFEAEHVTQRLGGQTADAEIAAIAVAERLVLVTKDDDFALRHPPDDYQLVWLRCGSITNRALRAWLIERWMLVLTQLEAGERLVGPLTPTDLATFKKRRFQ